MRPEAFNMHGNFKGKNLSAWAEVYPRKFCKIVAEALQQESAQQSEPTTAWSAELFAAEPDALVDAPDLDEQHDAEGGNRPAQIVSAEKP